jgi:hypothetical protein
MAVDPRRVNLSSSRGHEEERRLPSEETPGKTARGTAPQPGAARLSG